MKSKQWEYGAGWPDYDHVSESVRRSDADYKQARLKRNAEIAESQRQTKNQRLLAKARSRPWHQFKSHREMVALLEVSRRCPERVRPEEISIRTITLTVRQQAYLIGHLSERVTALEKAAASPQDTLNRRLKALDEKWSAGGLTCDELDERAWLVKRINQMPPTVGNAYTSLEGWEAKQKAAEAKCGYDELGEAHKYLDTLGVPRSEHPNSRSTLQGRIDCLHGIHGRPPKNKWRDAKTDPPTKPGHYIVHFVGADRTTTLDFDGYYWVYCDTKTPLANPFIVALWQELPPPPQATEPA